MDTAHNKTTECSNRGLCDRFFSLIKCIRVQFFLLIGSLVGILENVDVLVDTLVIRAKDRLVVTQIVMTTAHA